MEDSCPATPLVLVERDSKSPLQVSISSPESDGMKSPDSRCVICLGKLQNKSFTDSCLHQFCFQCLLQWSKVKPECPLCKQPFKSIIHNVRSNMDYDQYHIEHGEPRYVLSDLMHSYNFDLIPVDRRFRYRSTMTREYFRELAESFLAHTQRLPEDSYRIPPMVPIDPSPPNNRRHSNRLHGTLSLRTRRRGTSDFRRNVYLQDLWVQDLADISGRYRECTPQFYRENPAQLHRIIPWLNREVNVLLTNCDSQAFVLSKILSSLTQNSIRSREFRQLIQPYFGNRTDHFIHEFYTFARSVYDIAGFDQNAIYITNPNYATEVQEIISSSEDSDVEVLETIIESTIKPEKTHKRGFKKTLLKRAHDDKVEEPIAGPSGVGSASLSDAIEICESEDEIKVLDYVKPEPEVVTLSSGEESSIQSSIDLQNNKTTKHKKSHQLSSDDESSMEDRRSKSGKGKCKASGFGLKGKQKSKYIKSKRNRSRSRSESTEGKSENKSSRSETKSESECENRNKREDRSGNRSEKRKENKSEKKRRSNKNSIMGKIKTDLQDVGLFSRNSSTTTTKSDRPNSYCSRTGSGSSQSVSSISSSSSSCRRSRSRSNSFSSNSRASDSEHSFSPGSSKSSDFRLFKKSKKKKSNSSFKKYKKKSKHKSSQSKKKRSGDADIEEKKKVRSCIIIPESTSMFCQDKPFTPTYWSVAPNPAATKYYKRRENLGKVKIWDNSREKRSNKRVRNSSSDFSSDSSEKYSKGRNKDTWPKNFAARASHEISSASWCYSKKFSKVRSDDSGSGDSSSKNFATGASHESTSSSNSSVSSSNTHTTATSKNNSSSSSATDGSH